MSEIKQLNRFNVILTLLYAGVDCTALSRLIVKRQQQMGLIGISELHVSLVVTRLNRFKESNDWSASRLFQVMNEEVSLKVAS
ncbi:MAG TPA: hypothetical protein ENI23_12730 [bacterium]|nr:hypothetical protein [bacterium]